MKWIILVLFFATTVVFAVDNNVNPNPVVNRVIETYDNSYSLDTCLSNPNTYVQQQCKAMRQAAEANAAKQVGNGTTTTIIRRQTTEPSVTSMPAWQQALQPRVTTITREQDSSAEGTQAEAVISQSQATAPSTSTMPAWQQALEPKAPAITTQNVNTELVQ